MSSRFLITGARSPAALELARHCAARGHQVFVGDSVRFPIAQMSRSVRQCFLLPSARFETTAYIQRLKGLVQFHKIDLIVPTCEEAFFLSAHKEDLETCCSVFCAPFETMKFLHSKWNFLELARGCGLEVPESHLIHNEADKEPFLANSERYVFKEEFSRFASNTLISPPRPQLQNRAVKTGNPLLAQKRIFGKELCSYSLLRGGQVHAHATYHPKHRVGPGSGLYFEPVEDERTLRFVQSLGQKTSYQGQIGFDFIDSAEGLFVLEANPRATSGVHLFEEEGCLADALLDACKAPALSRHPLMVAYAFGLFHFLPHLFQGRLDEFFKDWVAACDVVYKDHDFMPALVQGLGLAEVFWRSLIQMKSLTRVATEDIEWNGEDLR